MNAPLRPYKITFSSNYQTDEHITYVQFYRDRMDAWQRSQDYLRRNGFPYALVTDVQETEMPS